MTRDERAAEARKYYWEFLGHKPMPWDDPKLPEEERDVWRNLIDSFAVVNTAAIPVRIPCPECGVFHVDEPPWDTKPHHTHACQQCGNVWRPAVENTVGVRFLPGFKNEVPA